MCPAAGQSPPPPIPARPTLIKRRQAAQECRACELWEGATQAVIGAGRKDSRLMLVGEQPGDREDIDGHPFVGPAGRVLDRGLARAGIERKDVYVTNVLKHFRYKARGKRRIHQRPTAVHVSACMPWLKAELAIVAPEALVCLGATAAQALLGSGARIERDRRRPVDSDLAALVTVPTHPSAILRMRDEPARQSAMDEFVADLERVARWLDHR